MQVATTPDVEQCISDSEARVRYPAWVLYFAIVVLGFPLFRYLIAPDPISYISIARHYVAGDWADAINTYWSPLVSWLMSPLILAGIPGLIAIKIVTVLGGAAALFATMQLARGFELSRWVETAVSCTAALMIAAYSLLDNGPDVFVIAIVLFYFSLVFDSRDWSSRKAAILCGVLGALGFYTKAYLFCFFLAHFTAMAALHYFRSRRASRRQIVSYYLTGLAVFLVGCVPWLIAMRAKTGHLDLGTTGAWNERMVGPQSPGYAQYYGLITPPNPQAVSMWESPSPNLLPAWHPLGSPKYELRLIFHNLKWLRTFLLDLSLLSFAAVLAYIVWGLSEGAQARYWWPCILATLLILPAGYLLITIEERYLWPGFLVILLSGAVAVDAATRSSRVLARRVAIALYALSFAFFPVRQLAATRNSGRALYSAASTLHKAIPARSRLAACGSWNDSLAIAYYLNLRFYGSTAATPDEEASRAMLVASANPEDVPALPSPSQIAASLRKDQISYYLVWPSCRVLPPATLLAAPIDLTGLPGAKIFRVAESGDSPQ